MAERSTRNGGAMPTGQYRLMDSARAPPSASQGGSARSRSASATPAQPLQPVLGDLTNQIPPSAPPPQKQQKKQAAGTVEERVLAMEEELRRERAQRVESDARAARAEQAKEKSDEQYRRLQIEAAERPPQAARQDDDEEEEERAVVNSRKRQRKSKDQEEFRHQCQYFTYFYQLYLTAAEELRVFTQKDRGQGHAAEVYDGAVEVFGTLDDLDFSTMSVYMGSARSEAKNRIKNQILSIFDVTLRDLDDENSTFRQQVSNKVGLGWTFHDYPACTSGMFQSELLIKCMSALLYGPDSIRKETAAGRAGAGGESKGAMWDPPRITRGFVAFTCTVVCNQLRRDAEFRMNGKKNQKRNLNLEVYAKVLELLERSRDEDNILAYLSKKLIPDESDDGGNGGPVQSWEELFEPDVGAFVAEDEDDDNAEGEGEPFGAAGAE